MSSKSMPQARLFDHLVATGVIDEKGVGAHPRARTCTACRRPVLAAWEDGVGPTAVVDPVALTPRGELDALMAGRRTFDHWGGDMGGLALRRPAAITRHPAGWDNLGHAIRPEHRCGAPPPDHSPDPRHQPTPDAPPF